MLTQNGTKLVLTFLDASGNDVVFTFDYANSVADVEDVKALMSGIITNGSIFQNVPVTAKAAKTVTVTSYVYDLSD